LATPVTPQRSTPTEKGSQLLSELLSIHKAKVIAAIVAIIVLGAGAMFYQRSAELKVERAEIAYLRARQTFEAAGMTAAETDLRSVISRYSGTAGGAQAALALAQGLYEANRVQEAIDMLRESGRSAPRDLRSDIHAMIAAGFENINQFEDAAREYERAAEAGRFPRDRLGYRAAAARAYMGAGNNDAALAIWRELEEEPTQFLANEARVRIGEITAQPEG
jgi:tetratricopeptide (TPR) repeat protein